MGQPRDLGRSSSLGVVVCGAVTSAAGVVYIFVGRGAVGIGLTTVGIAVVAAGIAMVAARVTVRRQ
jgi:hypothetical protein